MSYYVESDGDRVPKGVYVCDGQERVLTMECASEDRKVLKQCADEVRKPISQSTKVMSDTPDTSQAVDLVSAALVKCQGAIKAAEFDATNPFFKSKYATLGSVIAASREALHSAGLAILQVPSIEADRVSVHTLIIHSSGQSLDGGTMSLPLEGNDRNSDAQVAGSILTYLKRYAWASVLGIYADSDDDGNSGPKGAIPKQTTFNAEKTRMKALNLIQAAPGQRNRNMFKDFLVVSKWIKPDQEPEAWPEAYLPKSPEAMAKLSEDIASFEMLQREEAARDLKEELI